MGVYQAHIVIHATLCVLRCLDLSAFVRQIRKLDRMLKAIWQNGRSESKRRTTCNCLTVNLSVSVDQHYTLSNDLSPIIKSGTMSPKAKATCHIHYVRLYKQRNI